MNTQNTADDRQTMDLTQLPESELCRMLTDCRITLESIRPYRDKATSAFQARLREEIKRRENMVKANAPAYVDPDGNPHYC